jgi:FkbM family methyltransferase
MFVFEPFKLYAKKIEHRFKTKSKIKIFDFGLSNANMITKLNINNDASSLFTSGGETVEIKLVKADDFLTSMHIDHIDLMKINIEGGEYDLLEYLIKKNIVDIIGNIQIQFHDFIPNAEERMLEIQNQLKLTHKLTYQYVFVWENWTLLK